MPRPFSDDLRWRMVYQHLFYAKTDQEIATNLFVCPMTVKRTCATFYASGDIKPWPIGRPSETISLFPHEEYMVMECLLEHPEMQLNEIASKIFHATGSAFSPQTLCRTVHRLGFTRKKLQQVAARRNENLRIKYKAEMTVFDPSHLVFLDETGIDKRISRQYGYSQRGTRASVQNHCYSRWGPRYNAVSAISSEGLIALELLGDGERFVTDTFETFLRNKLLPVMNAFNGQNPRSVIVMDNHPVHHVQEIVDLIYNSGVIVRYLPPYSPDLNPIEECFAVVKHYLRQNDLVFQSLTNPEPLIWDAFGHLSSDFCKGFMRHAGYL